MTGLSGAFGPPAVDFAGPIPWPALQSMFDALYPPGLQWYWKADFVAEWTFETAERASSVVAIVRPSAPMAPAFDTAIASSGLVVLPCGASKIGYFKPNSAISAFARSVGIEATAGSAPKPTAADVVVMN